MGNDLAKRVIACKGWRWVAGMLAMNDWRVLWSWPNGTVNVGCSGSSEDRINPDGPLWYPDLTDPATLGCLLALVREAWRGFAVPAHVQAQPNVRGGIFWVCFAGDRAIQRPTEAEALVAALEAAEGREVSDEVS